MTAFLLKVLDPLADLRIVFADEDSRKHHLIFKRKLFLVTVIDNTKINECIYTLYIYIYMYGQKISYSLYGSSNR